MVSIRNSVKRFLIIFSFIIVIICLYTVAFQWYFNPSRLPRKTIQEVAANLKDDNGAKYYLMACAALTQTPEPVRDHLENVFYNGWSGEDPVLEDFINKNQPALDLVEKGIGKKYCSMPADPEPATLSYSGDFRQIARLFAVKGLLLESKKEFDSAEKLYIESLRFARDIANDKTMQSMLVSNQIEGVVFNTMQSYVRNLHDETLCARLLNQLIEIENGYPSLHDVLEGDFAFGRRSLKRLNMASLYMEYPVENPNFIYKIYVTTVGYVRLRIRMSRTLKDMEAFQQALLEESKKPYPEIFGDHLETILEESKKKPAEYFNPLAKDWVSETMAPAVYAYMSVEAQYEVRRRANIIMAALHLYYLEHGKFPESLEELASVVPESIMIDPFSVKHFVYKKTDDGYLFYSFGPDLRDDGGREMEHPYSPYEKGDIVFSFSNNPSRTDENVKRKNGAALINAALNGYTETVKGLLAKGADVNARANDGSTPLIVVALEGHTETVKALLDRGADPNAKTNGGETSLMFATSKGYKEIVQLLRKAGAKE